MRVEQFSFIVENLKLLHPIILQVLSKNQGEAQCRKEINNKNLDISTETPHKYNIGIYLNNTFNKVLIFMYNFKRF